MIFLFCMLSIQTLIIITHCKTSFLSLCCVDNCVYFAVLAYQSSLLCNRCWFLCVRFCNKHRFKYGDAIMRNEWESWNDLYRVEMVLFSVLLVHRMIHSRALSVICAVLSYSSITYCKWIWGWFPCTCNIVSKRFMQLVAIHAVYAVLLFCFGIYISHIAGMIFIDVNVLWMLCLSVASLGRSFPLSGWCCQCCQMLFLHVTYSLLGFVNIW